MYCYLLWLNLPRTDPDVITETKVSLKFWSFAQIRTSVLSPRSFMSSAIIMRLFVSVLSLNSI